MATIYVRVNAGRVKEVLGNLPQILAGKVTDPTGQVRSLQLLVGQVAASLVTDAYVQKARGGTDAAGEKWAPLQQKTVLGRRTGKPRKGKKLPRTEILRDTGTLLNSLGPGVSVRVNPGEILVGTNVPYAKYHHRGTKNMPQRRLWPAKDRWPKEWHALIAKKLAEGIGRLIVRLF